MAPNRILLSVAVLLCATLCASVRTPRELRESTTADDKKNAGSSPGSSPHPNHISHHHRKGVIIEAVRLRQSGGKESRGLTVMEKYGGRKNETIVDECVQNPKSPDEKLCRKFTHHADGKVSTTDSTVQTTVWRALKGKVQGGKAGETSGDKINSNGKRKGHQLDKPYRKKDNPSVGHWASAGTSHHEDKQHPSSKPHRTPVLPHSTSSTGKTEEALDESSKLAFEQLDYPSGERTSNKRVSMNFTLGGY